MFVNGQGTAFPPWKFLHPWGKSHASLKNELFFFNHLFLSKKYHVSPNARKVGVSSPPHSPVRGKETGSCACGLCVARTRQGLQAGSPTHPTLHQATQSLQRSLSETATSA